MKAPVRYVQRVPKPSTPCANENQQKENSCATLYRSPPRRRYSSVIIAEIGYKTKPQIANQKGQYRADLKTKNLLLDQHTATAHKQNQQPETFARLQPHLPKRTRFLAILPGMNGKS